MARANAQEPATVPLINREYPLKAVYLYQFSVYTQWPEGKHPADGRPFVIGVYPSDPFGAVLDQIAKSKSVEDHPIVIRRLSSLEEVKDCHILFLRRNVDSKEQQQIIEAAQDASVLVVGELDGFAKHGGMIEFYVEENKVHFIINVDTTKNAALKISSKLLAIARIFPDQ